MAVEYPHVEYPQNSLAGLPAEMLAEIIEKLPPQDVATARLVCRRFDSLIGSLSYKGGFENLFLESDETILHQRDVFLKNFNESTHPDIMRFFLSRLIDEHERRRPNDRDEFNFVCCESLENIIRSSDYIGLHREVLPFIQRLDNEPSPGGFERRPVYDGRELYRWDYRSRVLARLIVDSDRELHREILENQAALELGEVPIRLLIDESTDRIRQTILDDHIHNFEDEAVRVKLLKLMVTRSKSSELLDAIEEKIKSLELTDPNRNDLNQQIQGHQSTINIATIDHAVSVNKIEFAIEHCKSVRGLSEIGNRIKELPLDKKVRHDLNEQITKRRLSIIKDKIVDTSKSAKAAIQSRLTLRGSGSRTR